jgi:hypothetical protein
MANCIHSVDRVLEATFWKELGESVSNTLSDLCEKISKFVETIWKTVSDWFSNSQTDAPQVSGNNSPFVFPLLGGMRKVEGDLLRTISCLYSLHAFREKASLRQPIIADTIREIVNRARNEELGAGDDQAKLERFMEKFQGFTYDRAIDLNPDDEINQLDRLLNEREESFFLTEGGLNTGIYADRRSERYLVFCPHLPEGPAVFTFQRPREVAEFIIENKENFQMQLIPFKLEGNGHG